MRNPKENILVVGLLKTGSSALVDLLREYNNIKASKLEFDDYRAPGMVADQLSNQQSFEFINRIDIIVRTRLIIKLIYNIFPIFHLRKSLLHNIRGRYKSTIERIRQLKLLKELNNKLTSTISLEEKIRYANQWILDLGNINSKNIDFVVYNQPLQIVLETPVWKEVFKPCKLIVVYRDPKDQLADLIEKEYLYAPYGAPYMNFGGVTLESIYGRSRKSAIKFHIEAIKKRFEWIDMLKKQLNQNQFLLIDFEGLVNNYDLYKTRIENFIGNSEVHHVDYKKYFDPKNARKSVGMYKEILNDKDIESLSELENWYKKALRNNFISEIV